MQFLKENFSFLFLIIKWILALTVWMMAFAVLRKGQPKMMGTLSSPPVSKTTMSLGTYDCPTRMIASLRTPLGEQSD
jgi:hypothetical protein